MSYQLPEKFLKPYEPGDTEDRLYKQWEESGYFNPDKCIEDGVCDVDAEHFSIVLPPPNVTGQLHLGHAFEDSTQDAMIRFNRMRGKRALWVPGTDHAAIATQSKFEKQLTKTEKKSRHDFSREEFFGMVEEFALENQTTILSQLRKMGASLDWSRLCFTLDEERQVAVFEAFKRMYDMGLVYQKDRIVNWDVKGQTTISDDEIVREDRKATMYTFKYSHDFPFSIATTRPETKLGDTAVAVHPDDKRYAEYIGKEYSFNFAGEDITVKIVADEHVDPEFGVGALGVTPAHSVADWEIAERHNLPIKQVINEYGKMMVGIEGVKDVKAAQAREAVAEWLRHEGLMENEEEIDQSIATAERTGGIIEPLPKLQWWINVSKTFPYPHDILTGIKKGQEVSLKDLMMHAVDSGQVTIMPERFDKTYRHWIANLRDWNISRQILFGHRVPVWYDQDGNQYLPSTKKIHFMRHAESISNQEGVFAGHHNSPLSDAGKDQIHDIAKKIKDSGLQIARLVCSELDRSQKTAELLKNTLGIEVEIEILPELKEMDFGELTHQAKPETKQEILYEILHNPTTEDHDSFVARIQAAIEKIKKLPENSLVVGHGIHLLHLFCLLDGIQNKEDIYEAAQKYIIHNGEIHTKTFVIKPTQEGLTQDTDTLDTWFSSGLWTFSTLGWPNENAEDFTKYHPTNVVNPGYEILQLWVSRMILFSTFLVGQVPFETAYIHGMLRDAQGRKFSKSLNNGIDPLEVIEKYGTDALRMSLIIGVAPGQDMSFDLQKVNAYKKFANKLWNISRFILSNVAENNFDVTQTVDIIDDHKAYLRQADQVISEVTGLMNEYKFYLAGEKLYHYVWHEVADNILEAMKADIEDEHKRNSALSTLFSLLTTSLKLLHPFMPFITEEIWQSLPEREDATMLMIASWPEASQQ